MRKRATPTVLLQVLLIAILAGCSLASSDQPDRVGGSDRPPNILLIVADDLGYTDLGAFGSEIRTPNLDRLANEGVRLSNYHVNASCAPTRAALLSGTFPHVAGVGTQLTTIKRYDDDPLVNMRREHPGYAGFLNENIVTIPELLSDAGYRTYMAGKWHLGEADQHSAANRGFTRSFELIFGSGDHFGDASDSLYREDGEPVPELPENFYSTDFYTNRMISYIDEGSASGQPWFGYLAYTTPHWPLQVPDEWLDKYAGQYEIGYDRIRERRIEAALRAGVIDEVAASNPADPFAPAWDDLSDEQRREHSRSMEIYAAMVENLDHNVGLLIEHLRQSGELDNTVIIFMSDNGADDRDMDFVAKSPRKPPVVDNSLDNFGRQSSFVFYGKGWAQAGMGPFRYHKGTLAEGGILAAAFVNFANMQRRGEVEDSFLTVTDLSATILDIARIDHPGQNYAGRDVAVLEGNSFLPLLLASGSMPERSEKFFFWEHDGQVALIRGDWKYVSLTSPHNQESVAEGWHLFNIRSDPGETRDRSAEFPALAREFAAEWGRIKATDEVIAYPD